jgi:hypothetical protein
VPLKVHVAVENFCPELCKPRVDVQVSLYGMGSEEVETLEVPREVDEKIGTARKFPEVFKSRRFAIDQEAVGRVKAKFLDDCIPKLLLRTSTILGFRRLKLCRTQMLRDPNFPA